MKNFAVSFRNKYTDYRNIAMSCHKFYIIDNEDLTLMEDLYFIWDRQVCSNILIIFLKEIFLTNQNKFKVRFWVILDYFETAWKEFTIIRMFLHTIKKMNLDNKNN